MKELKEFTVERLEGLIGDAETWSSVSVVSRELKALAKIALAAKQSKPDYYIHAVEVCDSFGPDIELRAFNSALEASKCKDDHGGEIIPLYTTPPLNHTDQDGWIKCSDQLPPDDGFVLVWPTPDFGVDLHVGQYMKYHKKGAGWFAQVNEQNYGIEWHPIAVTHWMKLPAAPKPEM